MLRRVMSTAVDHFRRLVSRDTGHHSQLELDREAQKIYLALRDKRPSEIQRPFFLYLRNFETDPQEEHRWVCQTHESKKSKATIDLTTTEVLADLLSLYGPLIHVRSPKETNSSYRGIGNVELKYKGEKWLDEVVHLIVHANAIFIRPYDTPGIIAEFAAVAQSDYFVQKTFLVMEPDGDYKGLLGAQEQCALALVAEQEIALRRERLSQRRQVDRSRYPGLSLRNNNVGDTGSHVRREIASDKDRLTRLEDIYRGLQALNLEQNIDERQSENKRRLAKKSAEWQKIRRNLRDHGHDLPIPRAEGGIFSFLDIDRSVSLAELDRHAIISLMTSLYIPMQGCLGSRVIGPNEPCPCGSMCENSLPRPFSHCHGLQHSNHD